MLNKAPRSSSRSRSRGKGGTRSNRANTQPAQLPDYLKDPNYKSPYAQNNSGLATISDDAQAPASGSSSQPKQQSGHQIKKSTDDLLDLFAMGGGNENNNNKNGNSNGNDDFMNPFAASVPNQLPSQEQQQNRGHAFSAFAPNTGSGFGDDFFSNDPFSFSNNDNNKNNKSNQSGNNNNGNNNGNNSKNSKNSMNENDKSDEDDDEKKESGQRSPRPNHPPPKPKSRQARAQTDAVVMNSPKTNAPEPPKKVKTKSIDVLPLLHAGVKANKFKFGQNKSKVRTFYLTNDNQWFCWEPVGGALQSKNNRKKIDPTRSIFVRSIREVKKNSAAMVQDLNFIPQAQKSLTISIVYDQKGSEKKVNLMAYEAFHHVLIFEAIHKLSTMGQNINRDLTNVFELYVDFEKEILPKHLRPQRFKWEPLGQQEMEANKNKESSAEANDANGTNGSNDNNEENGNKNEFEQIDTFDPTNEKRNRLKSF